MILKAQESKLNRIYAYVVFLVWPFLSAIMAVFNYRAAYAKNIVWLFCAFFGYTFIISDGEMDANRYKRWLVEMHKRADEPYARLLVEPYKDKGIYAGTDVYSHLMTLTVSRFTDDFRFFFGLIGLVFGYFYSRNIFMVLAHIKEKRLVLLSALLLMTLFLLIPFWNINGYRFYTAAMVFLYGVLKIMLEKKYGYFWAALLSPLVHFSFAVPVLTLLIYIIVGNRVWIYMLALAGSLFMVDLNPKTINENADLAPVFMQNKVKGYSSGDYIKYLQRIQTDMNWYVRGRMYAIQFCIYSMLMAALIFRRKYLPDIRTQRLLAFGALLLAVANVVSSVPSMGRFFNIAAFVLVAAYMLMVQQRPEARIYRYLGYVYFVPVLIFAIVEIRIGFDFIGLNTLFLNPLIAPFFPDSPALIEFFKW